MSKLFSLKLSKKYGLKTVLSDVSIEIQKKEIVGLLGPNGAGKTSFFYILVGLVKADSGKIFLDDDDISNISIDSRSKVGLCYLPQESSIFRKLNVEENIRAVVELHVDDNLKIENKVEELLDLLSITHIKDSKAMTLSGGERRRVEIARALATFPKFLLLDEPFAGIDPIAIVDLKNIIKKLQENNIGILITDHNVRDTLDICNKAYIINNGSIIAHGQPEMIVKNSDVQKFYLGNNFIL